MVYTVTITRQGQISLPAKLRRLYGFNRANKAVIRPLADNRLSIEPAGDFLSLKGSLKTTKKIPFKKARRAFEEYLAKRHS